MPEQPSEFRVDRCVCVGRPFAELLGLADKHGYSFEQLCQKTGCCRGCGFCAPYVKRVLLTRETVLPIRTDGPPMTGEQIEVRFNEGLEQPAQAPAPQRSAAAGKPGPKRRVRSDKA